MRLPRQRPGALLGLILLVAFLFGAALLGAGPASAHDAVESTSPADGASVPAPPQSVSLTLNKPPLALGTQVTVNDAAGTDWADGAVQIADNVASQKLKAGAPAGVYTVQWRVASADGHPIEGTFGFTVETAATGSTTAGSTAAGSTAQATEPASAAVPTLGTPAPGTAVPEAPVADASQPFPWSIVGFVVVAVGILVALGLMSKRRLDAGDGDEPGSDSTSDGT